MVQELPDSPSELCRQKWTQDFSRPNAPAVPQAVTRLRALAEKHGWRVEPWWCWGTWSAKVAVQRSVALQIFAPTPLLRGTPPRYLVTYRERNTGGWACDCRVRRHHAVMLSDAELKKELRAWSEER